MPTFKTTDHNKTFVKVNGTFKNERRNAEVRAVWYDDEGYTMYILRDGTLYFEKWDNVDVLVKYLRRMNKKHGAKYINVGENIKGAYIRALSSNANVE